MYVNSLDSGALREPGLTKDISYCDVSQNHTHDIKWDLCSVFILFSTYAEFSLYTRKYKGIMGTLEGRHRQFK